MTAVIDVDTQIAQGVSLIEAGRTVEALEVFQDILKSDTGNVQALGWSGVGAFLQGDNERAISFLQNAHALAPEDFQILANLGKACMAAGQVAAAHSSFQKAYEISSNDAEVCYYLGYITEHAGDAVGAETLYRQALKINPADRQIHLQLSNVLHLQGRQREALRVLRIAEARFPDDRDITFVRGQLASNSVPGWHLPMLADQARNDAYERAIIAKVQPGDIVLDIGTGSGLLAMMAIRAGAAHVYACEADEILADLAREIVERNGFQNQITILPKHSTSLVIGEDMPRRADLLVTEIFDRAVIGEGVLPTMNHAWQNLLDKKARVIPEGATLFGALTQAPHLQRFHHIETINGFDLSPMTVLAHPLTYRDAQIDFSKSDQCHILSEPFAVRAFDFQVAPDLAFRTENSVRISESGEADSILMWFDLQLAPGVVFSTHNTLEHQHWRQATQILLDRVDCQSGQSVDISSAYNGYFDFSIGV
ncbi:MAG: tetratricopeptide repeat protein [Maricaulis sp.]|nr:tetratricopeptide repeat protein [Maricaulis sp.]MDG2044490.1 tetratricopeptide repeat protein [Maricaulis sp.]